MKVKAKYDLKYEPYGEGDALERWNMMIPEEIVDEIIKFLELDANKIVEHEPISYTLKTEIWGRLAYTIWSLGKPSPTKLGATPANLRDYSANLKKTIQSALIALKGTEYEAVYTAGALSKEYVISQRIRDSSIRAKANAEGKPAAFVSSLIPVQEHDRTGEWGKHAPYDYELVHAIEALEKILPYFEDVAKNAAKNIATKGKNKTGKEKSDSLIVELCRVYKKYTGEIPSSFACEDGTASGKIIPFLQLTLGQSSYPYEMTDWALEKKLRELKKHVEHGKLWQDGKN